MEPNKIKRFDTYPDDDHVRMFTTEDARGDWCKSEDVAKLEAINAELLEALENVYYPILSWLGEFDSESGLLSHPAMQKARAAIAKAKGEDHG